jgi:hypothetical protein
MSRRLDHEKLEVYQAFVVFVTWLESILVALIEANARYRLRHRSLGSGSA